ncbi:hypothetical protein EDB84DRAFT_1562925 [Lactarius hengduanensis]|nr:hypothetical protein EDB84DRAFT_1562925 [Lactarius hengduanensis]
MAFWQGPDAKVDEGLGPAVDSDSKRLRVGARGKQNVSSPERRRTKHTSQPKPPRRNKEQIEADRKAAEKALEEKLHDVRMAKERLVQLNRRHIDVESDDECFDLREADNGSNPDESSSESDDATKTKTKSRNKRVKGAARQELLTRTADLRGAKHTEETRRQQKSTHNIGRFTAQDLRCKKYANSGLRLQAPSLAPPDAALTPTLLQQPDDTDPLELGGLGDSDLEQETCPAIAEIQSLVSDKPPRVNELVKIRTKADVHPGKPQATRKPPCPKSKAAKAIVKKDGKCFTEAQPDTHPDITRQCLDDSRWTRIFLPTLSHALYISDHPFTDWTRESSALVETVQVVFELSFTNISYTLSAQDGIVKAAYDRMKTRRSKIASDVLVLVKTFFERAEFQDQPEKIKDYVHWALKSGGPAYYETLSQSPASLERMTQTTRLCVRFYDWRLLLRLHKSRCTLETRWVSAFTVHSLVAKTYLGFASRLSSVHLLDQRAHPGAYVMILTAVERDESPLDG